MAKAKEPDGPDQLLLKAIGIIVLGAMVVLCFAKGMDGGW